MEIHNQSKQTCIAEHAVIADTYWKRLIGLMGKQSFGKLDGLLFYPSNSIHTCFMRFPIDVLFLDRAQDVVALRTAMHPWRVTHIIRRARYVLELPAYTLPRTHTSVGDHIIWGISPDLRGI